MYKDLFQKGKDKDYFSTMSETTLNACDPKNKGILLQAKNYIRKQFNINDDIEATIKLVEINSERFIQEQLINLTNRKIIETNDSLYKLCNAFLCDCITEKIKGKSEAELKNLGSDEFQNCFQQLGSSPNAAEIKRLSAGMDQAQVRELFIYFPLYMCTHCSNLTPLLVQDQISDITSVYGKPVLWDPYGIMTKVEEYIRKKDTTTIQKYFTSEEAYRAAGNPLNLWKKAMQVKYHNGGYFDYRYSSKNTTEFYKLFQEQKGNGMDIVFMIKFVLKDNPKDRKIVSISYFDRDKIPQKEKVMNDVNKGKFKGD